MQSDTEYKPGISLCMIVKNEQEVITDVLENIKGLVDEMIVVDTGSADKTREYARSAGAHVFDFTWKDDFSKARNFSLTKAHHQWILVLDADEIISSKDFSKIKAVLHDTSIDAVVLQQRNYCESPDAEGWQANTGEYEESHGFAGYFDVPVIRFFRNDPRITFHGVVHELVDASIERGRKKYLDIPIHHYTYFEKPQVRKAKSEFYLNLLLKQLEDDPENSTTWFLIGRQYYTLGKDAEALVFFKRVIKTGSRCEMAYDNLAAVYLRTGMYEEARDTLEALLRLNPRYSEAFATLGVAYYELGMISKAIDTLRRAAAEQPRAFRPYFNLAAIYYREKNFNEALNYIRKAEEVIPHFPRVYFLKFFILYELGLWEDAHCAAERLNILDSELYQNIEVKHNELKKELLADKGVSRQ
jgi:tetratricopeptide (TPR) repeat protein